MSLVEIQSYDKLIHTLVKGGTNHRKKERGNWELDEFKLLFSLGLTTSGPRCVSPSHLKTRPIHSLASHEFRCTGTDQINTFPCQPWVQMYRYRPDHYTALPDMSSDVQVQTRQIHILGSHKFKCKGTDQTNTYHYQPWVQMYLYRYRPDHYIALPAMSWDLQVQTRPLHYLASHKLRSTGKDQTIL